MTQEELLPLILSKNKNGFTNLYNMYAKSLYAVIYNLIRNSVESEDVLQEVFVKICKNIETYNESKGRFYTWMLNIARNTAIDKLRSKGFNNSRKTILVDNFVSILVDKSNVMNKIDSIGIFEFVKKLKSKCIQIIELLFFQGFTQQEASDELKIPLGTVKTLNRNCINELRNYLEVK
jgi:RNA polymerase sigma-70 factor (ECF subfamily)